MVSVKVPTANMMLKNDRQKRKKNQEKTRRENMTTKAVTGTTMTIKEDKDRKVH